MNRFYMWVSETFLTFFIFVSEKIIGVHMQEDSSVKTSTKFAVLLCEMAVHQGDFIKVAKNHYKGDKIKNVA